MSRAEGPSGVYRGVLIGVIIAALSACSTAAPSPILTLAPSSAPSPDATAAPTVAASPTEPGASPTSALEAPLLGDLPADPFDSTTSSALQAVVDGAVADGAPDMIAAVLTAQGTWAGASGIDGPNGQKATAKDQFAVASVTKIFTAALIMRLVEQGKMDLDTPLQSYLGDLGADANGATVRQTLAMRSGLPADRDDAVSLIHADPAHVWTVDEVVSKLEPPIADPGTTYIYSNPGYALLALAAATVPGTSFAAALRGNVLDPVGASGVLDQGAGVSTPTPWAVPIAGHMGTYTPEELGVGAALPTVSSATYSIGGASMASDAPSLAAWAWHLFAGDVVSAASLGSMIPGPTEDYGLGVERLTDLGEPTVFGHTGSKTGYGAIVAVFPVEQAVVVVFVNDPDFVVEPYVARLLKASGAGK